MSASARHEKQVLQGTQSRANAWIQAASDTHGSLLDLMRRPEGAVLRGYLAAQRRAMAAIAVLGLLATALQAAQLVLTLFALRMIVGSHGNASAAAIGLGFHVPYLSDLDGTRGLLIALGLLAAATLANQGATLVLTWLSTRVQAHFMYEVRRDLIDKLLVLESSYFTESKAGDVAYLQNTIVNRFATLVPTIQAYVQAAINLVVAVATLMLLSVPLTGIMLLLSAGLYASISLFRRRLRKLSFEAENASREAANHFLETVQGIRLVRLGGQQSRVRDRYLRLAWDTVTTTMRQVVFSSFVGALSRVGGILVVLVLAAGLSGLSRVTPVASGAAALGFLAIALQAITNVSALNDARVKLASMLPQFVMIASFLTDDSFVEASALRPMPRIEPARDQVVTEHLRFEYEPGEPVLDDISLAFRRGTSTALVGASGSGKTTLVELLAGYRPVQGGRLLIDHQDIAEFDAGSYRDQVGYVTQDTIMFHDTLRKNLTFLRPEATDDEVARALSLAAADEFVDRRGLETILGEQGMKLSGGQRQRIALARVVLQDPGLLLLDEATSALDLYTEQRVFQNLLALREDKILVVVAHRLSAIARFDNIVVLHRGKVAEMGTHDELLAARGLYYHYYGLQEYAPEASLAALADL